MKIVSKNCQQSGAAPGEVDGELTEDSALSGIARIGHESTTELSPAGRKTNVDQSPDSALSQGKHSVWCSQLEFAQQRDRGNTRKFTHQRRDSARMLARTRN